MRFAVKSLSVVFVVLLVCLPAMGQDLKPVPDKTPTPAIKPAEPKEPAEGGKPARDDKPVKPVQPGVDVPPLVDPDDLPDVDLPPVRQDSPAQPSPYQMASNQQGPVLLLASVPNMFGDLLAPPGTFVGRDVEGQSQSTVKASIPFIGGGRRTKIADNNKPIPMDRGYFTYNHYHNAILTTPSGISGPTVTDSLDRFLIGFEKTFHEGLCSVDVRLPLLGRTRVRGSALGVETGAVGNLNIVLKGLLWATETTAYGAGFSIDTPTGSDVVLESFGTRNTIHNDAVYISPFIGFVHEGQAPCFLEGILQIDVPLNGNRLIFDDGNTVTSPGRWNDQTLLQVDLTAGWWLCRDPYKPNLTGLAAILELHVITALTDFDAINQNIGTEEFFYLMPGDRFTLVHLTAGVHAELWQNTTVRVGGVFPLQRKLDRAFDAEVMVSVNRYF